MHPIAHYALIFFFYSVLGWIFESSLCSIFEHKWINRGFLTSPILPIYGSGVLVMLICLAPVMELQLTFELFGRPFSLTPLLVALSGMVLCDILEFLTSYIMEKLFHARWWDYTNKFCNLQGRICLGHTMYWGIASLGVLYIFHPLVEDIFALVPVNIQYFILGITLAIFIIDYLHAVKSAANIRSMMDKINRLVDKLQDWVIPEQVSGEQITADIRAAEHFVQEQSEKLDDWRAGIHLKDKAKTAAAKIGKRVAQLFYSYPSMQKQTYKALDRLKNLLNEVGERLIEPQKDDSFIIRMDKNDN